MSAIRERVRRVRDRARLVWRGTIQILRSKAPELLVSGCLVTGWACVTAGVAALVRPRVVWPLSTGLLLFSCVGWATLRDIARDGLLTSTVKPEATPSATTRKPAPKKVA